MILSVDSAALSYGGNEVLRGVSFELGERDRMGVVGYNGGGKTTLLSIITGELAPSSGSVSLRENATIGYLKQTTALDDGHTLLEEMKSVHDADRLLREMKRLEAEMGENSALVAEYERLTLHYEAIDGYNLEYNIKKILTGMDFPPETWGKRVGVLSGGERTRLALAKLLIMNPDLLVLDEPTNHLDIGTLEWLEDFLQRYKGAVLAVSHDRVFLDHTCNRILEIINGRGRSYNGNYSVFLRLRAENSERAERQYKRTAAEAEKLRDYAERNIVRASTSNMAKSRLKMLDRLDMTAPENERHESVRFDIIPAGEPYKEVLTAEGVALKAGGMMLVEGLDFVLRRGECLAIVGRNGTGKTTLLRVLAGERRPDSGRVRLGGGVRKSYLAQNLYKITSRDPLYYIWDRWPSMTQLEIRSLLASVGFTGEEVFTSCAGLSGGELARLNMARVSLEHPNLLLLDEPTNHLDIYTKDVFCEAFKRYTGTMVLVSHDRYLLSQLPARILELGGPQPRFFESYGAWQAAGREDEADGQPQAERPDQRPQQPAAGSKEERRRRAEQRQRIATLESGIEQAEADIAECESQLAAPENLSDHIKLTELAERLAEARQRLATLGDEWLELSE